MTASLDIPTRLRISPTPLFVVESMAATRCNGSTISWCSSFASPLALAFSTVRVLFACRLSILRISKIWLAARRRKRHSGNLQGGLQLELFADPPVPRDPERPLVDLLPDAYDV
jgi:hypothetical protein